MTKSVGFDFDGVIHKDVGPTDKYGQRHPTIPLNKIPQNKFDKIIDLIKIYKSYNYIIYIITARPSTHKHIIKETLKNFSIFENIISHENIICTGDIGGDKIGTLYNLRINDFYDDSISHIKSVKKHKKKLIDLKNCYITIPEKNKIYKII
jgi:hypothetical protein